MRRKEDAQYLENIRVDVQFFLTEIFNKHVMILCNFPLTCIKENLCTFKFQKPMSNNVNYKSHIIVRELEYEVVNFTTIKYS